MKKLIVLIFNIIFACLLVMPTWVTATANAEEEAKGMFSLKYSLTAGNEQSVVLAEQGDVITVAFTMQRTDSNEDYTTNVFQNFICFDRTVFELVENSIVCNDTGSATAMKQDSIQYGMVIQCQNMGKTYAAKFVFCTFQLKVIAESGSGMVYSVESDAYDTNFEKVAIELQDLQVLVTDCAHNNKVKTAAKAPTCDEDGWAAYYSCADCGFFFDESGENLIPGVPTIAGGHNVGTDVLFDAEGHWHECAACDDKVNYAVHSGGKAACTVKAKCEVCGQEYGDIDAHNHVGKTYVVNYKETLPWQNGYSGDVYCSDCNAVVEMGAVVSQWNVFAWPWYIIIAGLCMLLLLIAVVYLFSDV